MPSQSPQNPEPENNEPWWRPMTGYHWFVFIMAAMAWILDCMDQQIFILARKEALTALLPAGTNTNEVNRIGGIATSIFMVGWATGGMFFGAFGDRFGRAKMLTVTVFLYSISTGLSAFSTGSLDFMVYRFLTGLGVGGVFGLAVALIADTLPDRSRTPALGLLQASSAIGNISAGLISMSMAKLGSTGIIQPQSAWKYMFLIGAIPAILCVLIQLKLREPEKWVKARQEGKRTGVPFGSYRSLFSDRRWRRAAFAGLLLCVAGVLGLWGVGFFSPELLSDVIRNSLQAKGVAEDQIQSSVNFWRGVNGISQNVGSFFGMIAFTFFAQRFGRKPSFAVGFIAAMLATIAYFQFFKGVEHIWMAAVMGFFQLALFAGFALYLPELFPLRLRSTGTSFCYNVGRYVAALGPWTLGEVQKWLAPPDATAEERINAFRDGCSYMSVLFLIGLVALYFLPETKGKPLPED